jgi:hypothetical protein
VIVTQFDLRGELRRRWVSRPAARFAAQRRPATNLEAGWAAPDHTSTMGSPATVAASVGVGVIADRRDM